LVDELVEENNSWKVSTSGPARRTGDYQFYNWLTAEKWITRNPISGGLVPLRPHPNAA
jgi:hypothetical protein